MQTEQIKVTGMTCGGCSSNVTKALSAVDGVEHVIVSLPEANATVQFNERLTSLDQLKLVVTAAGYGVDTIKASKPIAAATPAKGCCG